MAPATPTKADTKSSGGEKDVEFLIAVLQCFENEPKVDLEKLRVMTGMATKAAANTKWWRVRQKYMPNAVSPKKRKGDTDSDAAEDGDAKPKPKTPRKARVKKAEPEDERDTDKRSAVKKESSALKHEDEDEA
ncbi:uncharacterized protein B0I36DRAFT_344311 [Microdochium trichocladiopsis]|uniref:Uncharacterized protein n=1 Tax=Microdochium trichocladiopsis TaxID=1682393 RepID=A0A9P8YF24_9PEZI|nr:uncharacterized protein B0I36DRAFT_344311 [Microdochium trichocladiopsis]KAH7040592.1 hypothetical protein B0I36DRAFT_344311 [Microdochium trichocladiopsis]